ncbi:hypothetical protein DFJ77DRAFT_442605 [Powellomyces hirtus]|nr:hypothetical protein DFJ77DRAFT_442605 [Powellomyces hirtus]
MKVAILALPLLTLTTGTLAASLTATPNTNSSGTPTHPFSTANTQGASPILRRIRPRTREGKLDELEFGRLGATVRRYGTDQELFVLLDPHRPTRNTLPTGPSSGASSPLGTRTNSKVMLGFMNEPHDQPTEDALVTMQAGIKAIRGTEVTNVISVPGNRWTGGPLWTKSYYGTSNTDVMGKSTDPADDIPYERHQDLDADFSGT